MLAKQGWRLLTRPSSLCARVMKARYYPNSSILQADFQAGISYAWRSVLKGIKLLKQGLIKRVGDGSTINIWLDPWLPRTWGRKPITPRGNKIITKVCELIDPNTGSWDSNLVRDLFWPDDTNLILSIPIFEDMEDEWAWHFEEKGSFTVKSAYRLQRQLEDISNNGQVGCQDTEKGFNWLSIWKLECPLKIKIFIWRIAHDSLPHRVNLARKGVIQDPICPRCNRYNEDGAHLFLKCKKVKDEWKELQIDNIREKLMNCQDAKDFIKEITLLDKDQKQKTISLIWWLWQARNKLVAGESKKIQHSVSFLARKTADELDLFYTNEKKTKKQTTQFWSPPGEDTIKINIDGSYIDYKKTAGWGFIFRNSKGQFLGAGAGHIPYAHNALQAEAIACLSSLQKAQEWGMSKVQVETDSQLLVQAIKGTNHDLAVNGSLFRELKYFATLNFSMFDINYCPRSCNKVADVLADYGTKLGQNKVVIWPVNASEFSNGPESVNVPEFVNVLLASDYAVLDM